jgi:hypothetical protein
MNADESAAIVATSLLFFFVGASQATVSLLGRRVPLPGLDRQVVPRFHRRGRIRPLAILSTLVIAVGTQALDVAGLLHAGPGAFPIAVYLTEPALALLWVGLLVRTGTSSPQG